MDSIQMPKKWPEILRDMELNGAEEVTTLSTVYSAMEVLRESEDPEENYKRFTIRTDPNTDVRYCWRIK